MFRLKIKLYNLIKSELKLSDAEAEVLITALDEKIQAYIENSTSTTRRGWNEDVFKLRTDLQELRLDFQCKLKDFKFELYKRLAIGIYLLTLVLIIGLYFK